MLAAGLMQTATMAVADENLTVLRHNPFQRPTVPEAPVDPPARPERREPAAPPVLSATLVSSNASMAILDGKLLSVGAEHAGYRLVAVEQGRALFEREGEQVQLKVTRPKGTTTTGRRR
jgi:hypothetical protein